MAGAAGRRNILKELVEITDANRINIQNTPSSSLSMSPDESVIQERGQRKKSATYNYDAPDPVFFRTPTKSPKKVPALQRLNSPLKTSPVRSSPRKRLNLTPDKLNYNEAGIAEMTITCKRFKKGHLQKVKPSTNFEKGLKALSHAQLVKLVNDAVRDSPEFNEVVLKLLPVPDLTPIEDRLYMLQRNVYKSFPRNVWGSQESSFCYLRVRTHLEAYKKECLEVCHQLMDSQHWPTVFEYIFMAWKLTMGLPDWADVAHNKIKNICMKQLAAQCLCALKKADLDSSAFSEVIERMQEYSENTAVESCIKFATDMMKSLPMDMA